MDGKIPHKALYNILGINKEGYKEILGIYIPESEGANFWLLDPHQPEQSGPKRHPYRLYGQSQGLYRCDIEHFPQGTGAALYRTPDKEFVEVRSLQGPKGVHVRPETCLLGYQ